MDLLEEIRKKTTSLDGHSALDGVKAVVRHIQAAERNLSRAREEHDDDLFNDVIYRTNQAFEGMLKEAYSVLTDEDSTKLNPHQIEQHLLQSKTLASRVWELFKNYRQQWRNPSTHDHKLFFSDQEALLAIVSVSAFTNILLDQIVETISRKREQEEVQRRKEQLQPAFDKTKGTALHEELIVLLELFSEELIKTNSAPVPLKETEIIGRLHGFFESLDSESNVVREPLIPDAGSMRPDFLITKNNKQVIIEVKRAGLHERAVENGINQLLNYLFVGGWDQGILYIPPVTSDQMAIFTSNFTSTSRRVGHRVTVHAVIPREFNLDVIERLMLGSS